MTRHVRRLALLVVLAALVAATGACSKKNKQTETGLSQQEADDLVQQLAALASADAGGWLTEVQVTSQRMIPQSAPLAARSMPMSIAARETMFTKGGMNWRIQYTYFDRSGGSHDVWDTSAVRVDGLAFAKGSIPIPSFMGSTGESGYGRDSSSISVDGLSSVSDTAITFSGFSRYDTTFTSLQGTTGRYYFLDNVVTYGDIDNVIVLRGPGAPAFPVSGEARIDIFAAVLKGQRHASVADVKAEFDAVMVITFERAQPQNPVATITANTESATTVYRYRIDLKTGTIQRI